MEDRTFILHSSSLRNRECLLISRKHAKSFHPIESLKTELNVEIITMTIMTTKIIMKRINGTRRRNKEEN
jgi:hypothetical protein